MFCGKCGKRVKEGDSFCTCCGENVHQQQQDESSEEYLQYVNEELEGAKTKAAEIAQYKKHAERLNASIEIVDEVCTALGISIENVSIIPHELGFSILGNIKPLTNENLNSTVRVNADFVDNNKCVVDFAYSFHEQFNGYTNFRCNKNTLSVMEKTDKIRIYPVVVDNKKKK